MWCGSNGPLDDGEWPCLSSNRPGQKGPGESCCVFLLPAHVRREVRDPHLFLEWGNGMSDLAVDQNIGVEGLTGLDVDALEISDYMDETLLDSEDLTVTMVASASCTTCICTCSCSS